MSFLSPSSPRIDLGIDLTPLSRLRDRRLPGNGPDQNALALIAQDAGADVMLLDLSDYFAGTEHANNLSQAAEIVRSLHKQLAIGVELTLPLSQAALEFALQTAPSAVRFIVSREGEADPIQTENQNQVLTQQHLARLRGARICAIVLAQPSLDHIRAAQRCGAQNVEISAVDYVTAPSAVLKSAALHALDRATQEAVRCGLRVQVAGGLDHRNISAIAAIDGIRQINVGYAVAVRALTVGWQHAVSELQSAIAAPSMYKTEAP